MEGLVEFHGTLMERFVKFHGDGNPWKECHETVLFIELHGCMGREKFRGMS